MIIFIRNKSLDAILDNVLELDLCSDHAIWLNSASEDVSNDTNESAWPLLPVRKFSMTASKSVFWYPRTDLNVLSFHVTQFGLKGISFSQMATLTTVPLALTAVQALLMLGHYKTLLND